ncbi:MarP family serine protease [Microbacterium album]|uniref:Membrane-associated serine protease n=1 Tax=Microbacterium album TaxID=2053191 RepID=A0A917MMT8_9MICO|nr:MarP family serine protease [Microbacterium album]GGH49538.1 putative membrane-associated serine protease [Microbacterium album]
MLQLADVVIVVLLLGALVAGLRAGLFSALGSLCGLVAGGIAAPWLLPLIADAVPDREWRGIAIVGGAVLLLAGGTAIGAVIGVLVRRGADRLRLRVAERLLGGVLGVVAAALAISLAGSGIAAAGIPVVSSSVASSTVLRTIDRFTPEPIAEAFARLHSTVLGDALLPAIDGLLDDADLSIAPRADQIDTSDPALAEAGRSVARISGVAYACGTSSTGTGFVAAEGRVVTNAHVVAGVDTPVVELPGRPARDGRVVYFDPVDDLAVIAVDVDAPPLRIVEPLETGAGAVVQGYPHGGPFRTVPAGIAGVGTAPIADIYGGAPSERALYTLAAEIAPGNSGGPLLTESGAVAGVVFARDEVRPDVGYAMTTAELLPVLAQLDGSEEPVEPGRCIRR